MAALARRAIPVALFALVVGGCDYFRPAVPERPTGRALPVNYSWPDSSLETMNLGLAEKSPQGADAYLGALAESTQASAPAFHQFFSPEDIATWPVDPPDWDRSRELVLYNYLIRVRPIDDYKLLWAPGHTTDEIHEIEGTAEIQRHYQVVTYSSETDSTIIALGYVDLVFYRDAQGHWLVTRWQDHIDPDAPEGDQEQITLGRRRLRSESE